MAPSTVPHEQIAAPGIQLSLSIEKNSRKFENISIRNLTAFLHRQFSIKKMISTPTCRHRESPISLENDSMPRLANQPNLVSRFDAIRRPSTIGDVDFYRSTAKFLRTFHFCPQCFT